MAKVLKVVWTETAQKALRAVFDFHAENSEKSASRIVDDIIDRVETMVFQQQYQVDEINANYRRIVVRNYKILYLVKDETVLVMNVFSTKDDPGKLKAL